ncbi:hypothetical protein BDQ17DRAFT_1328182 [Cyathus striatus]|nr:hypothetical protein BDQ17DRAFT_1328182 [Cyathus striatus]
MDSNTSGPDFLSATLNAAFYGFHACLYMGLLIILRQKERKFQFGITQIASTILFLLCTVAVIVNLWGTYEEMTGSQQFTEQDNLEFAYTMSYALIDFVAQSILLYRCWIIWDKKYFLIIFPGLLAIGSLAGIIGDIIIPNIDPDNFIAEPDLAMFSYSSSLAVNALVTGLIVSRIWFLTSQITALSPHASNRPYNVIIAMLLESGALVLLAQICWLVLYIHSNNGYDIVSGAISQIYGFTPAILLIRVALGTSYDSETKLSTSIAFADSGKTSERHPTFMTSDEELGSQGEATTYTKSSGTKNETETFQS